VADKEDLDIDFDDDFDDILGMDDNNEIDTENLPKGREAVVKTLKDGAKGFTETYTDAPLENVEKIATSAIPKELSVEVDTIKDLAGSIKDEYKNTLKEVKKTAKPTLSLLQKIAPKNEVSDKIFNKLHSILGESDSGSSSGPSKEEIENRRITDNINSTLSKESLSSIETIFKDTVERNRFKTELEASNLIAARLTEISSFNKQITNSYFRKSLELQYKSLFVSKQQLDVTKNLADVVSKQLEGIVKNTALPDIVKIKSTEGIKQTLRQKATTDIADVLFKKGSVLDSGKDRIKIIGSNLREKLIGGLEGVSSLAEQKAMMDDMAMPGMSEANLAGGLLADGLNSIAGSTIGRKISNSKRGKDLIYKFKNAMVDPSVALNNTARDLGSSNILKRRAQDALFFTSDILKTGGVNEGITVDKDDLDEVKLFDGRAYNSLTKVIPGLLSKIYGEIKSFRTGTKPSDNELTYDFTRDKFIKKKNSVTNFKKEVTRTLEHTSANALDNIIGLFVRYGNYKVNSKEDVQVLREALSSYVINGKPLVPAYMEESGFLDSIPKKYRGKVKTALKKLLVNSRKDSYILDSFISSLKAFKESLPKLDEHVRNIIASGNGSSLAKSGIVDFDKLTGTYTGNTKGLNKLYLESLKKAKIDENLYSLKQEKVSGYKEQDIGGTLKDSIKGHYSTIKEKNKRLKEEAGKLNPEYFKDKANNYKESFNKKREEYKNTQTKQNRKLTPDEEEALKEDFLTSEAYQEGTVQTFKEYKEALGFEAEDDNTIVNTIKNRYEEKKKTYAENVKQYVKDRFNPNLKTLDLETEKQLREEFLKSEAFLSGKMTDFNKYVRAFGYRPRLNIKALLKKTRALDRKIMGAAIKVPGKALSFGWKHKSKAFNLLGKSAKYGAKGIGTVGGSVLKQFTGYDYWGNEEDSDIFSKTRAIDRDLMKNSTRYAKKSTVDAAKKTKETVTKTTKVVTEAVAATLERLGLKTKKKNKFDKDGDGDRDGNWKDRLKSFIPKGNKKAKGKLLNFVKEHKGLSGSMLFTAMLVAMKSMGITMEDVKDFVGGAVDGIKTIGGVLGGIWDVMKGVYDKISTITNYLKEGLKNLLPDWMSDGEQKWYNPLTWGNDSDGTTDSSGTSAGKTLAYGAAGYVGYKTTKGVYKTGKAIGRGAQAVAGIKKKVKPKIDPKKKVKPGKLKSFLRVLKKRIIKKVGLKAGAKLLAKIASRFVPIAGWGLLAYDAGMIGYDMVKNGTDFKTAASNQILGFDIFSDDDIPVDVDGKPIKPDTAAEVENKYISNTDRITKIDTSDNSVSNNYLSSFVNTARKSDYGQAVNNALYKANMKINSVNKVLGDGEDKPSGGFSPSNNNNYSPSAKKIIVRGGEETTPIGGENNITKPSNVRIDGLNPVMLDKLKAMANEYYELTGKKIHLNSGYRSTADQIKLRKKYGSRAARPGHSTHEFGLAVDINGKQLDELEQLGLLGKYKFTRPVGGEKWHMEPAGIQLDINNAKKDPNYAAQLIDGVTHGGSGWGLVSGVRKYSRNEEFQKEILKSKPTKIIDPKTNKPLTVTAAKDKGLISTNKNVSSSSITMQKEIIAKQKSNSLVKPMTASADLAKVANKQLASMDATLKQSLEVQTRMMKSLDVLVKQNKELLKGSEPIDVDVANNVKRHDSNQRESLPEPAISLARKY